MTLFRYKETSNNSLSWYITLTDLQMWMLRHKHTLIMLIYCPAYKIHLRTTCLYEMSTLKHSGSEICKFWHCSSTNLLSSRVTCLSWSCKLVHQIYILIKIHCCYRVKTNQLVNNDQSIVCIVLRFHKYFISKHLFGRRNIIGWSDIDGLYKRNYKAG